MEPNGDGSFRAEGVTKVFNGSLRANDEITLQVEPGEVYGLLGPNGAGKSTLVKQVIGLLKPTEGRITLGPFDLVEDPAVARQLCSYLPQAQMPIESFKTREAIRLDRPDQGRGRRHRRSADRRADRGARSRRVARHRRRETLGRGQAAGGVLDGVGMAGPGRDPGRAHERRRPAAAAAALGPGPPAGRVGQRGLPGDPQRDGGREVRRPPGDHRGRPADRGGDAVVAEGAGPELPAVADDAGSEGTDACVARVRPPPHACRATTWSPRSIGPPRPTGSAGRRS